ncbi:MAG: hypothetical protein RL172_2180 [Bacteroidota bacterium]|jgi:hypothetical protein
MGLLIKIGQWYIKHVIFIFVAFKFIQHTIHDKNLDDAGVAYLQPFA